jgi:uncharacterized membrane protein YebE (DUF533 family)
MLKITKDTLLAITALAWADTRIEASEIAFVKHAVEALKLDPSDAALVLEALSKGITLAEVETIRMDRVTRLFTYAVANLVAEVDGALSDKEKEALGLLGDRLGLSESDRERARGVALSHSKGATPDTMDLLKLGAELSAELSQIPD